MEATWQLLESVSNGVRGRREGLASYTILRRLRTPKSRVHRQLKLHKWNEWEVIYENKQRRRTWNSETGGFPSFSLYLFFSLSLSLFLVNLTKILPWKRESQLRNCLYHTGLWACLWAFAWLKVNKGGPSSCGWCHPRQEVLGGNRKQSEQTGESKPVSRTPPWPRAPAWVSLDDEMNLEDETNPFLPKLVILSIYQQQKSKVEQKWSRSKNKEDCEPVDSTLTQFTGNVENMLKGQKKSIHQIHKVR